jgi:hypothetical protein
VVSPVAVKRCKLAGDSGSASLESYATLQRLWTVALIWRSGAPSTPPPNTRASVCAPRSAAKRRAIAKRAGRPIAEFRLHGADPAWCQGARLLQLQMPAAATAINFKRLLNATKPKPAARAAIRRRRPRRSSR